MAEPVRTFQRTPLSHKKLKLYARPWVKDDWKAASLEVELRGGNPYMVVWPNNPKEDEMQDARGRTLSRIPIRANMDMRIFNMLLNYLRNYIGKPTHFGKTTVINRGAVYDEATNEPIRGKYEVKSKVTVGRHPDGYLFLAVAVKGRDTCVFPFEKSFWFDVLIDDDSVPVPDLSDDCARAWIKSMEQLLGPVTNNYFSDDVTTMQVETPEPAAETTVEAQPEW